MIDLDKYAIQLKEADAIAWEFFLDDVYSGKPMSQEQQILTHLKTAQSITAIEALNRYGCFRLAARINDLRRDGHNIVTSRVMLPNGKIVAQYSLVS